MTNWRKSRKEKEKRLKTQADRRTELLVELRSRFEKESEVFRWQRGLMD